MEISESEIDPIKTKLFNSNQSFRDLVQKHQIYEDRLTELAHLNYPSEDEQIEETTIKKKKLKIKDKIQAMLQAHTQAH